MHGGFYRALHRDKRDALTHVIVWYHLVGSFWRIGVGLCTEWLLIGRRCYCSQHRGRKPTSLGEALSPARPELYLWCPRWPVLMWFVVCWLLLAEHPVCVARIPKTAAASAKRCSFGTEAERWPS
jgi:hypothetical protein